MIDVRDASYHVLCCMLQWDRASAVIESRARCCVRACVCVCVRVEHSWCVCSVALVCRVVRSCTRPCKCMFANCSECAYCEWMLKSCAQLHCTILVALVIISAAIRLCARGERWRKLRMSPQDCIAKCSVVHIRAGK